jgi:hypothetical protein
MQALLMELAQAIDGLLVQGETDAPLSLFSWPAPLLFTPQALLAAQGLAAEIPIERRDLAAFFGPRTRMRAEQPEEERANAQRFQRLRTVLETHLTDLHVLRVGTIEITSGLLERHLIGVSWG